MWSSMKRSFALVILASVACISVIGQPGTIDPSFNPTDIGFGNGDEAGGQVNCTVLQPDGKILLGGEFTAYNGVARKFVARLNADGTLDTSFDPGYGPSEPINSIALQDDGRILICGEFGSYSGVARSKIARLHPDGSLDTSFDPEQVNGYIYSSAIQADGRIIIGGSLITVSGLSRNGVARLNADGSLDESFDPGTGAASTGGFSMTVRSVTVQPDSKVVIAGTFNSYDGVTRNHIARINMDGSLDPSFNPGSGASGGSQPFIYSTTILPDGKLVIGGGFTSFNGSSRPRIARLNSNGTVDQSFNPGTGAIDDVFSTAVQPDMKILVGGRFFSYNGTFLLRSFVRLNENGTIDDTFSDSRPVSTDIRSISLQPDGKIIIGGDILRPRGRIGRLNHNGTWDMDFNPGTGACGGISPYIHATVVQADGKIVISGEFTRYNGTPCNHITRMDESGTIDIDFVNGIGTGPSSDVYAVVRQSNG